MSGNSPTASTKSSIRSLHKLNLAIVSACKISSFKNAESYLGEISRFFAYSAKRQRLLDKAVESVESSSKAKKLKDVCRTRWVQRIDSYIVLPAVHKALKAMVCPNEYPELGADWAWDGDTMVKVTEFTLQQREQRAHRLIVISFVVLLCDYFCLLTSLFPLLWCKFCNLLCACLLANGCFLHQHSKQKKSHTPERSSESTARG